MSLTVGINEQTNFSYVFNETIFQLIPALLAMIRVLLKHTQSQQLRAVNLVESIEIDEFLAEEKFQKLPVGERKEKDKN
jgi:acyl-CoA reductase-like NAD-dependent aldehyde dehydrogenase